MLAAIDVRLAAVGVLLFVAGIAGADDEELVFPTGHLRIGSQIITVEVANSPRLRQRGLMHREELPAGRGMLFVFSTHDQRPCFWMRNTLVPLDLAFISADGRILQVEARTDVLSDQSRCSVAPVPYALELPLGWLARHGLGPNHMVHGLSELVRSARK